MYDGISECDWVQMRKLLRALSGYDASTLVRIWSGVPLTLAHRSSVSPGVCLECPCGGGIQNIKHLMWHCCMLQRKRPMHLRWWASGPEASVNALLPQPGQNLGYLRDWKAVCRWGIAALKEKMGLAPGQSVSESESACFPYVLKGHLTCASSAGTHVYCAFCHIARKLRDHAFIGVKECEKTNGGARLEGTYFSEQGHHARVTMGRWKNASLRPKYKCCKCAVECWSTRGLRDGCEA